MGPPAGRRGGTSAPAVCGGPGAARSGPYSALARAAVDTRNSMDQPDAAPDRDWTWEPVGFAHLDRGQLNAYATHRLAGAYNLIVHLIDGEPIRHTGADGGPPPGGPYPGYQQAADAARAAIGADGNYLLALAAYQAGALDPRQGRSRSPREPGRNGRCWPSGTITRRGLSPGANYGGGVLPARRLPRRHRRAMGA